MVNFVQFIRRIEIESCSLFDMSMYFSDIKAKNERFLIFDTFSLSTFFATMSSNSFWNSSYVYFLHSLLVGAASLSLILFSSLLRSKRSCVKLSWPSCPCNGRFDNFNQIFPFDIYLFFLAAFMFLVSIMLLHGLTVVWNERAILWHSESRCLLKDWMAFFQLMGVLVLCCMLGYMLFLMLWLVQIKYIIESYLGM